MDDLGRQRHGDLAQQGHARSCAPSVRQASWRCCAKAHVASVCFNCFRGMLEVFRMDVAKVDRNGAYASMAIHACCKSLFQKFCLFLRHILQVFYLDVAYVSRICCVCFIWILHMLATAFKCFQAFCMCFRYMLQVLFYTYVASVSSECCKSRSFVAYIAMAIHVCCQCMFQIFQLF